jgi:hypothetical protein
MGVHLGDCLVEHRGFSSLGAVDVELTAEELSSLEKLSRLPVTYPAWMESMGSDRRPGEARDFDAAKK